LMRSLGVPEAAKAPFEEGRAGKEKSTISCQAGWSIVTFFRKRR
jgi:hypothetical protein